MSNGLIIHIKCDKKNLHIISYLLLKLFLSSLELRYNQMIYLLIFPGADEKHDVRFFSEFTITRSNLRNHNDSLSSDSDSVSTSPSIVMAAKTNPIKGDNDGSLDSSLCSPPLRKRHVRSPVMTRSMTPASSASLPSLYSYSY